MFSAETARNFLDFSLSACYFIIVKNNKSNCMTEKENLL